MADALDAGGQHMQHETADKLSPLQPDHAFAAMIITAHRERYFALSDGANTLVADGRAVRVWVPLN